MIWRTYRARVCLVGSGCILEMKVLAKTSGMTLVYGYLDAKVHACLISRGTFAVLASTPHRHSDASTI